MMEGLVGYGSDESDNSRNSTPIRTLDQARAAAPAASVGTGTAATLEAEWECFQKLIMEAPPDTPKGAVDTAETVPSVPPDANSSMKKAHSSSEDDESDEDPPERKKKKKKKRSRSSSSSSSSDKSSKSGKSSSSESSEASSDDSDDSTEAPKKKKSPVLGKSTAPVVNKKSRSRTRSRSRSSSKEPVKKRSQSPSSSSERQSEQNRAECRAGGGANGEPDSDPTNEERKVPCQSSDSLKKRHSQSRSPLPDRPRKSQEPRQRFRSGSRSRERRKKKWLRDKRAHRSRSRGRRSRSRERRRRRRSRSRGRKISTSSATKSPLKSPARDDSKSIEKKENGAERKGSRSRSPHKHKSPSRRLRRSSRSPRRERRRRSHSQERRRRRSKSESPPRRRRRRRRRRKRHPGRRPSWSRSRSRSKSPIKTVKKKRNEPLNYKEQLKQSLIQVQKQAAEGKLNMDELTSQGKGLLTANEKPSILPLGAENPLVAMAKGQFGQVTPQQALLQTMAAMHQKAQELTGVAVPKYYNPASVNPLKYAEQVQKRKLLWSKSKDKDKEKPDTTQEEAVKGQTQWEGAMFAQDQDGKQAAKFRKLMGMKEDEVPGTSEQNEKPKDDTVMRKQAELFSRLDQEYEFARMATHTHRGIGLGFSSIHGYTTK